MTQQVQDLIDKIKMEGIGAAEKVANNIKQKAQDQSNKIIEDAKSQAQKIIDDVNQKAKKVQESTYMSLQQASRDTLLSLRKEIENQLQLIIKKEVKESLKVEQLGRVLEAIIKETVSKGVVEGDIVIDVNKDDLDKLKKTAHSKLQKQLKQKIILQSSGDIGNGFTISFDSGKSSFDFTDQSLAQFLSTFLNTQVSDLMKESVKSK